jgi:hypothetical protein
MNPGNSLQKPVPLIHPKTCPLDSVLLTYWIKISRSAKKIHYLSSLNRIFRTFAGGNGNLAAEAA